ncbi:uncharacterized protein LOC124158000 [Ischnura elegans]|uniref:uncharacterized protein LOC124158000 n=1 Tax=Ischnura elegans TaxID=197161 RepID=UPI001ED895CE|nr:uncharacterized protein LOC124158000 [Ischnura elegans]
MAPTIWCRGGPSDFHRKHPEDGGGAAGIRTRRVPHPITADKEAEAAPHMEHAGGGEGGSSKSSSAGGGTSQRGGADMSAASPAPRPKAAAPPPFPSATDLILRKVAFARRRRRRGGVSATWCQSRATSGHDASSGDDMISTTGCAEAPSSCCSAVFGEARRPWPCGGPKGPREAGEGGLRGSKGLLGITVRTVELMRRNQLLQWRLSLLQEETRAFVESVLSNPENRRNESPGGEGATAEDNKDQDPAVSGSC